MERKGQPYPFQTIIFALEIGSLKFFTDSGPQSSPIQEAGMPPSAVADPVWKGQLHRNNKTHPHTQRTLLQDEKSEWSTLRVSTGTKKVFGVWKQCAARYKYSQVMYDADL